MTSSTSMSQRVTLSAQPSLSATATLLKAAGLPSNDLTPKHLEHFFYLGAAETPTAVVGVELYGTEALLRSLVVSRAERVTGLGSVLTQHVEEHARKHGARSMYLLTTTAESFFARRGYRRISRDQAAPAIRATREFKELCPQSSALMVKAL